MRKISSINYLITKAAKAQFVLAALGVCCLMGCSSESSEEVNEISDQNPMVFSSSSTAETTDQTRAAMLEQDFRVACWKKFAQTGQQVVMDGYKVAYNAGAANKWSYDNVAGQFLKYWDLKGYPYEFRAATPYTANATFSPTGLSVDQTASGAKTFKSQTFLEEVLSQDLDHSEACLVAQVSRTVSGSNYVDKDVIMNQEINEASKTNAFRTVNLPFHHLMSKVGFRFYIDDSEVPSFFVQLSKLEITAKSATAGGAFVTEGKSYTATNAQGLLNGTFGNQVKTTGSHKLLTHTAVYAEDMRNHLSRDAAFNLLLNEDDLLQIPQNNFQMHVKLTLTYKGGDKDFEVDLCTGEGDNPADYIFSWLPNTHYIYYLHINQLEKSPVLTCTAELVPWDLINSSDINITL